jgi:hypothetical protein
MRKFVGRIYVACDDGDTIATVTCRDSHQFRHIAEESAVTLDENVFFDGHQAFIGFQSPI